MSGAGFLYVFGRCHGESIGGPFKIGLSANPDRRLKSVQDSCPHHIAKLCAIYAHDVHVAGVILAAIRRDLAERRLSGGWFAVSAIEITECILINYREKLTALGFDDHKFFEFAKASGLSEVLKQYSSAKSGGAGGSQ